MPDTPTIDTVTSGGTTYDIVGKKVRNTNTATGAVANLSVWFGTQAQYDALSVKDPATIYKISNESPTQTVYDSVLTIKVNSTSVGTFTANASVDKEINIVVPTTASDVGAVASNTAITGATKCKITYDSKGLVTGGANLSASDIPNLTLSKITDVTATASELNVLDGITATTTELNYVDGVTSAIQTQLNGKQATISDLATIRSGASAGATALQSGDNISELTNDAGYTKNVGTVTSVNNVSPVNGNVSINIPTVSNSTILFTQGGVFKGSFTLNQATGATIALDAGGGSGAVNSVNGQTGTVVLDAEDVGALPDSTVIPTDTADLTNGAGFITSSALTGYATEQWIGQQGYLTGITSSDITTALGYTPAKNDLSNITSNAGTALDNVGVRTVVNSYVNGTNWYRVYSDKWVEQGGFTSDFSGKDSTLTVSLLMALKDSNYTVVATTSNCGYHAVLYAYGKATTSFKLRRESDSGVLDGGANWVAYGYKS